MDSGFEAKKDYWSARLSQLIEKINTFSATCSRCEYELTQDALDRQFAWAKPAHDSDQENCFVCNAKKVVPEENNQLTLNVFHDEYHFHDDCYKSLCDRIPKLLCTDCLETGEISCDACCKYVACCCNSSIGCIKCLFSQEGAQLCRFFGECLFDRCTGN